jgi:Interferon-induced transmembrane protein
MTSLPSSPFNPTTEVDVEIVATALNRKFKSQAIVATVKIDLGLEVYLAGLSIPNPQQMTNVVKQVMGKLQIPEQTVKVFGSQADATEPSWEREVWIEPIVEFEMSRVRQAEPEIDREPVSPATCPENNMTLAILATVLGVLPLGVIAIIYASQVNPKHAAGDSFGATSSANNSKRLSVISLSVSGVLTGLIFLAIILPVFLGGGFRNKIKQEKIAQKYTQTIMKAKMEEQATANASNNNAGISTTLTPVPPQDSEYEFKSGNIRDSFGYEHNFMITATPTRGNLRSFTGVVYTIQNGSTWFVKTDGCISKSPSYFPPLATLTSGKLACDATSTLASEQAD